MAVSTCSWTAGVAPSSFSMPSVSKEGTAGSPAWEWGPVCMGMSKVPTKWTYCNYRGIPS
jgi:hypothetical protein